jgi:hypothetical protein
MFRFKMLFALVVSALVGLSMVPSANAYQASMTVVNNTDLTVRAGANSAVIAPHSVSYGVLADVDANDNVCVHAESEDGSRHWDITGPRPATLYINP